MRDSSAANENFAIGRYAYAVYDEGGLLDINVAGNPSNTTATQMGRKGVLAFADLTLSPGVNIPQIPQIDNIVGWRNYASISLQNNTPPTGSVVSNYNFLPANATDYFNFISQRSDGFMTINPKPYPFPVTSTSRTDQAFVTRQDLLRYRRLTDLSQNALQYLATFSRELNAPSWMPSTPAGSLIDYAGQADNPSSVNRNFANVRVTAGFTRFDGSPASIGEPLVKRRFPLKRLAWVTHKGPSASLATTDPVILSLLSSGVTSQTIADGTAANIQKCFGLTYDSTDLWTYAHGAANRILTLSEVGAAAREPDFFELLQASILSGSLGQSTAIPGTSTTGVTGGNVFPDIHMSNTTHHILSIGAAIFDQADPDSIPTRIQFSPSGPTWTAYGVESLPYITQIYPISGVSPANSTKWATYLLFQLWNPHVAATLSPAPPQTRLRLDGNIGIFTGGNGQTYATALDSNVFATTGQAIALTAGAFGPGSTPAPLGTANAASAPPVGSASVPCGFETLPPTSTGTAITDYIGLRLLPDYTLTGAPSGSAPPQLTLHFGADSTHRFNATMEYDAGGGTWIPYNRFIGINDSASWIDGATVPVRTATNLAGTPTSSVNQFNTGRLTQNPPACFMKADPRATRFGIFQMDTNPTTSNARIIESLWPTGVFATAPNGYGGNIGTSYPGPVQHAPLRFAGNPYYPATFCINDGNVGSVRNTVTTSYADNDGVIRPGDAVYPDPTKNSSAQTGSSTPYSSYVVSTVTQRPYWPVLLNRPFRNVAELDYAFRDLPWKTLDLFTDSSADAGLLDVFSINDEPNIVAGHVNLNTQQSAVLQSVLVGAIWDELDSTQIVSNASASVTGGPTMAAAVVQKTSAAPFQNRADLITRSTLPNTILPVYTGSTANQTKQLAKAQRETVTRALSSVTQTRTWNLMIDVIAQSGRYPPTAINLSQFVVEGEKRYWLHVAIDRFTGEVIDQQLEVVYE